MMLLRWWAQPHKERRHQCLEVMQAAEAKAG